MTLDIALLIFVSVWAGFQIGIMLTSFWDERVVRDMEDDIE